MSSTKSEERNEKIIRGLMKLPPNRRCINCNSLGPQYVCTTFWTFVCITCSGIHREFTHRVKSVSMSKFTSQEVEALQKGGNQRARETFLNAWDQHMQRFPDSSNADKIREFIKAVYVDKKYAGGKTSDKPPRGTQDLKNHEDETRRASSYHSYSQSPPYDYQYEERRYGKQAFALTRKAGSDRGLKTSSFLSPSHSSDNGLDGGFSNEGSNTGDLNKYETQAPTFQTGFGFGSPSSESSRDIFNEEINHHNVNTYSDAHTKGTADQVPHSQRTASTSSFGSFNSNSMSFKSVTSENADGPLEPDQSAGSRNNKLATFLSLPHSTVSGTSTGVDLFDSPFVSETVTSSASAPDLFKLPRTSTLPVDWFQTSSPFSTSNSDQQSQNLPPPSLDIFSDVPQPHLVGSLSERSLDVTEKNEGWATFDVPQLMEPSQGNQIPTSTTAVTVPPKVEVSLTDADNLLLSNTTPQWSSFLDSGFTEPHSSIPDKWHESMLNFEVPSNAGADQSWNAFDNLDEQLPFEKDYQQSSEQVAVQNPSSFADGYMGIRVSESGTLFPATDVKSTNPFDIPFDTDLEPNNEFLDMSSLQAVLPNGHMPASFIAAVPDPWFSQNPITYPGGPQGDLGLFGGPAPSTQILGVASHEPVAQTGGNPFA
ncbi:probable ADP-ribosylation factor GTPase-activating protein AGD14 isoform X1 [Daucus carota subsp. sativus]|uniref:probable ADP-ribosylation factor GTPase-activating protein AGD14 isoform X1 n=1 Tax=Daucus carota subsp. sativus TaxID=79200 RepID=UPI0007EF72EB|nr:PREDICTED: probable ADP-ribosylation factor GTPase-activating protein AGD14 [Daucus carota subsp. sativus]